MLEYNREELGAYLAESRTKSNMTQAEVADKLGYSSAQFISNIERGVSVAPLKVIGAMIRLYKCDPNDVVRIMMASQLILLRKSLKKRG
jgi:transcriptional regulator with XRE-family HTH domain